MISYELAKKLKDAGFPNIRLCERLEEHEMAKCGECDTSRYPTLSELIEAIEQRFILKKNVDVVANVDYSITSTDPTTQCTDLNWSLHKREGTYTCFKSGIFKFQGIVDLIKAQGSTPEEAVANLWLELNKKR